MLFEWQIRRMHYSYNNCYFLAKIKVSALKISLPGLLCIQWILTTKDQCPLDLVKKSENLKN